jgi:hypothetical protein
VGGDGEQDGGELGRHFHYCKGGTKQSGGPRKPEPASHFSTISAVPSPRPSFL